MQHVLLLLGFAALRTTRTYTHLQKAACVSIDLLLFCLGLCAHMIIYRCINLPVARAAASSCRQCGTSPQLSSGWPCIQMCAPGEISACWYSHANGCEGESGASPRIDTPTLVPPVPMYCSRCRFFKTAGTAPVAFDFIVFSYCLAPLYLVSTLATNSLTGPVCCSLHIPGTCVAIAK